MNDPLPPVPDEPTVRLVYSDLGLADLFARSAMDSGTTAELLHVEDLPARLTHHLRQNNVGHVTVEPSKLLEKLGVRRVLAEEGFAVTPREGSATICGCVAAIAETGSLAFAKAPGAPLTIIVVEPRNLLPDLVDWLDARRREPADAVIVTGSQSHIVLVLN